MNPTDKAAGERLRMVRKSLQKTTYEMAETLKIPQSSYSKYEHGHLSIKVDVLKNLYLKFKVLPTYICLGKLPMLEGKEEKGNLVTDLHELKAEQESLKAKVDFWIKRG